jgi:hypothetical protein
MSNFDMESFLMGLLAGSFLITLVSFVYEKYASRSED